MRTPISLVRDLEALVEPTPPGNPGSPLRWTRLSQRSFAIGLEARGHHRRVLNWC